MPPTMKGSSAAGECHNYVGTFKVELRAMQPQAFRNARASDVRLSMSSTSSGV
jgi:hypothetical protein